MGRLIIIIPLLFFACNTNESLSNEFLFYSQQNVFVGNKVVSLYSEDRWGNECQLFLFDENRKMIDDTKCPVDIMFPAISYKNDSTLIITYNIPQNDTYIEKYLKVNPIILDGMKIEYKIIKNYTGNGLGIDYEFDSFTLIKEENMVNFFNADKLILSTSISNIYSAYGKIEYRENESGFLIFHKLNCPQSVVENYYKELIN